MTRREAKEHAKNWYWNVLQYQNDFEDECHRDEEAVLRSAKDRDLLLEEFELLRARFQKLCR